MAREAIYGRNAVRELLRAGRRRVHDVWATEERAKEDWVAQQHPRTSTKQQLGRAAGSSDHQGIVAFADPYPYVDSSEIVASSGPIICLDQIQDPRNLGAVARVADALGAAGLVIAERGSPEVTPTVCKVSAGAVEHILVSRVDNMARFLNDAKSPDRWVTGTDAHGGEDYRTLDWDHHPIIVMGAEGEGLRPRITSLCDRLAVIPMNGQVDSLNLSVATALIVAEAQRS